ncbi:GMC oxidoreductase [Teichococcus aestuarii]|uniref:GMC oxidoreductase n=1 Tax=Teichococcus aestuarii TaxID=568898 RepID=UPI003617653A
MRHQPASGAASGPQCDSPGLRHHVLFAEADPARRHSLYRAYLRPWLDRPNLTVLTGALVHRVVFDGRRATGVEILLRLRSADPLAPLAIEAGFLSDPADMTTARACVELCRALGNAPAFRPFVRGEAMPGPLKGDALDLYIRDAAVTYWHQSCTARMGRDKMSVVDATLKAYGVDGLRVADASIMPRVTTGNTQAPCAIIGERAAGMIRQEHGA